MQLKFKDSFWGYFKFYYNVLGYRLILNLGLSILISFLDGMGLAMFMPLLQSVGGGDEGPTPQHGMGYLHYLTDLIKGMGFSVNLNAVLCVLIILFVFKGCLKFIQMNYQVNLRHGFIKKIRFYLVKNLQGLTYEGFLKLDAGRIQNSLTAEVQRLFQSMTFYFNAAQGVVMLATYIFLAFLANYQFAFLVGVGAGLSNFLYRKIYVKTKKASFALSKSGHNFNGFLIQAIHYFKYLKSTNYFPDFSKKLKKVITETEVLNRKIGFNNAITVSVKEPIIIIIVALVIYAQVNWMGANLTSILLSLLLFYRALSFLMVVQNFWQSFIQNIGSMNSVATIAADMVSMQEEVGAKEYKGFSNEILIKDVHFSYGPKTVLKNMRIHFPHNQTIALIGESGSGKTTLANMLAGLIHPQQGSVLIDNVPLTDYNLYSFRSRIGYISQEPVIFSDNIYNNITFFSDRTPENLERFWNIVELASLTEFIKGMPKAELTELGDNGILISGGQKQRISIARELYKDVDILILDEATSSLDSETEKVIKENIDKLHGSYSMIIIAHRLSTIKNADIIYLLEDGKVVSQGKFDDMMEVSQKFKRMVELQDF